ncbi:hypothetical protein PQ455_03985 [Sphingomonas naphthae]|uniref:S-adenosyl-L-homocysteine hydrolase n=1 Tax=Sphingomonas naphthae TaxID=1813468 RepID=A0ABY7TN03_9SPHN|nr:hypothetical protein [Sphingomonas naphthae]WCT74398.1 hypothetical protein PQ455_03985 [Sphingomonas naphthae]
MRKLWGAACVAAALATAPVQAACWNTQDVAAARVRDLQSMLMVATLRCQAAGIAIAADYNGFVGANKQALQMMNDLLKRHFSREKGVLQGQKEYDSFTTRLANTYGAGGTSSYDCETSSLIARDARMMNGNVDGLLLIADRAGIRTEVPGGMCGPMVLAQASGPQE